MRSLNRNMSACSGSDHGVDDDFVGVLMNYLCCVILLVLGSHLWRTHGWERAKNGTLCEYGMSVGYLTGGLVHHLWSYRASNNSCASQFFYPVFALSYGSMIASTWAWLDMARRNRRVYVVRGILVGSSVCIVTGATWCQATVHLVPGKTGDCPSGKQPLCDVIMAAGEGGFYLTWSLVWFVVAYDMHPICQSWAERTSNWLAPVFLAFGPLQIVLVSVIPMLLGGGPTESLRLYCDLRVGVTYIVAVLLCHVCSVVVSDRVLSRSQDVADVPLLRFDVSDCDLPSQGS